MHESGDKVKIKTKDVTYEGILMPRPELLDRDTTTIKLDNGYNVGIKNSSIEKIELLEKYKPKKHEPASLPHKKGLPTIVILHTGGTIASKADYRTGGVDFAFSPEELICLFPELAELANIESELVAKMWSDDLRFSHFSLIAAAIEKWAKLVDGIIVGIGTDNLAVAAAALSFVVEETPVPIIFVGAQRSSDRGSSDAAMNLLCAAEFITQTDYAGVAICMHQHTDDQVCAILPATKTRKMHSSRRDAFKPINDGLIATVDFLTKRISWTTKEYLKKDKNRSLIVKPKFEDKVGLIKITVNMFPEQFEVYKGFKGLVIEGTGLGHAPIHVPNEQAQIHKKIEKAIKDVVDSGCVVVMTLTTLYGRVNMHVYSKGRDLLELGVIPGEDMLPETALVKLSWLLANHKKDEVKLLMAKNLRGEISERTKVDSFL